MFIKLDPNKRGVSQFVQKSEESGSSEEVVIFDSFGLPLSNFQSKQAGYHSLFQVFRQNKDIMPLIFSDNQWMLFQNHIDKIKKMTEGAENEQG